MAGCTRRTIVSGRAERPDNRRRECPRVKLGSLVTMAVSSSNLIEVRDLVKRYKKADRNAVDGVSFGVRSGEFFSLLGPNGAGKTTTISILTTTLTPTSGHVTVDGLDAVTDAAGGRRKVGDLFQKASRDQNL